MLSVNEKVLVLYGLTFPVAMLLLFWLLGYFDKRAEKNTFLVKKFGSHIQDGLRKGEFIWVEDYIKEALIHYGKARKGTYAVYVTNQNDEEATKNP